MSSKKSKICVPTDEVRYALYENSVQDAPEQARLFERFYKDAGGADPKFFARTLRALFGFRANGLRPVTVVKRSRLITVRVL